jgi:hypothetical protein
VARTLGGAPRQPSPVVTTTAAAGPRILVSTDSVEDGEQVVRLLKDDFAQVQLSVRAGARPGGLDAGDPHALGRAIDQLRQKQVEATRGLAVRSIERLRKWTRSLREQIEPSLAGTRPLAEKVGASRAVLMAVEDEELTRRLISLALDPRPTRSGSSAMRRRR